MGKQDPLSESTLLSSAPENKTLFQLFFKNLFLRHLSINCVVLSSTVATVTLENEWY